MDKELPKIVLVDDEPGIVNAIARNLHQEGFEVIKTYDGATALEKLKSECVAVIICDQMMPGMSGVEVLRKAKVISPDTIRITLTAYADVASLLTSINEGGITQFLLKPWDQNHLLEVVKDSFEKFNAKVENRRLNDIVTEQNRQLKEVNASLESKIEERTSTLQKTLRDTVVVLSKMMEMHSEGLCGRAERVATLSKKLAECYMDEKGSVEIDCELVGTVAYLHDIGAISIPPSLVKKEKWQLSKHEKKILEYQPVAGYELLKDIDAFSEVAKAILHQNENFAGRGYPDGISGAKIPLLSRIVAVSNEYDNLTHPFGSAVPQKSESALDALSQKAGKKLDPELVSIFLEKVIPHNAGITDEDEIELPLRLVKPSMELTRNIVNMNNAILIKSGTSMTEELIERLLESDDFNPVKSKIYITKDSIAKLSHNAMLKKSEATQAHVKKNRHTGIPIVAVDDEQGVLNALKRELRPSGYDIEGFSKIPDAMQRLRKRDVLALISDFNMPGIKGDEFIKIVQREYPKLPCLILTGYATKQNVLSLTKKCKLVHIFTKPWDKNELLEVLDGLKNRSDLQSQHGK